MTNHDSREQSRAIWYSRIEDWRKSNLSQAEYCRQQGLNSSSFYNWLAKYRDDPDGKKLGHSNSDTKVNFIPINLDSAPNNLTLRCGDVSLHFSSDLNPDTLTPWIRALRAATC